MVKWVFGRGDIDLLKVINDDEQLFTSSQIEDARDVAIMQHDVEIAKSLDLHLQRMLRLRNRVIGSLSMTPEEYEWVKTWGTEGG